MHSPLTETVIRRLSASLLLLTVVAGPARAIEFEEATDAAGVSGNSGESFGAAWGDYDGDGYPDLFLDNHREFGRIWRNNGNGTFTDTTSVADGSNQFGPGSPAHRDTHGSSFADLNGDGRNDLITTTSTINGGFLVSDGTVLTNQQAALGFTLNHDNGSRMPVALDANGDGLLDLKVVGSRETAPNLFLQQAGGGYTMATNGGDVTCPIGTQWAQFADINGSGPPELLCGNGSRFPISVVDYESGNGVTVPFAPTQRSRDALIADFDNDGRLDLMHVRGSFRPNDITQPTTRSLEAQTVITNGSGQRAIRFNSTGTLEVDLNNENWNFIVNNGGTLADVYIGATGYNPSSFDLNLSPSGVNVGMPPVNGRAGMFIGYENGQWQMRVSSLSGFNIGYFEISSTGIITNPTIDTGFADQPFTPRLQLNTGAGFVDGGTGLSAVQCVTGAAADFDNDMDQDVFLGCRGGTRNIENVIFENLGNGNFQMLTGHGAEGVLGAAIADGAGQTESVVVADYDADGFVDVFVANGLNLFPLDAGGPSQLFKNKGNGNHWVQIDLRGMASNYEGHGARVRVTAGGVTQYQEQNGGYHRWSQNHDRLHFGLAANTTADITIEWPNGQVDTYTSVAADAVYRADEGASLTAIIVPGGPAPSCGPPAFDPAAQTGYYLWEDCSYSGAGRLFELSVAGGGQGFLRYDGELTANQTLAATAVGLEPADVLDSVPGDGLIDFALGVSQDRLDGFTVVIPDGAASCFEPQTAGQIVTVGSGALTFNGPFNLENLGSCSTVTGTGPQCGEPTIDVASEPGLYLWQDCDSPNADSEWHVRAIGGGGSFVRYLGDFTAPVVLAAQGSLLEGNDVLDSVAGDGTIDFDLGIANLGIDNVQIDIPAGEEACVTPTDIPGGNLFVGETKVVFSTPFNTTDLGACN